MPKTTLVFLSTAEALAPSKELFRTKSSVFPEFMDHVKIDQKLYYVDDRFWRLGEPMDSEGLILCFILSEIKPNL